MQASTPGQRHNLLILLPDLEFGGGQLSTIRLANGLAANHNVYLYNVRPAQEEAAVVARIAPRVKRLASNADPAELLAHIRRLEIEVVNTHIWWADAFYHRVLSLFAPGEPRPRWVLSMHGCYELLQIIPKLDSYYELNSDAVIRDSDAIVYIADKNTAPLIARLPIAEKITKLAHGYALPEVCAVKRTALGIAENDFVFGIVSRAIPQKGWECAIEALQIVHARGFPQSHLVLVGGGDFQRELADRYAQRPHLHFAGSVSDPHNYVAIFDVGLLPTWFVSESLPGTIIEYLAQGKPVIATSLGEIPNMLRLGDDVAGIILPGGPDQPVAPETLAGAMMEMLQDGTKRKRFASVAARAAGRFGMEKWLAAYSRILFPSDLMAPAFDLQASSGEQRRARKF